MVVLINVQSILINLTERVTDAIHNSVLAFKTAIFGSFYYLLIRIPFLNILFRLNIYFFNSLRKRVQNKGLAVFFIPLPKSAPTFDVPTCERELLKQCWENEKMLVTSIFFPFQYFLLFRNKQNRWTSFELSFAAAVITESLKFCSWWNRLNKWKCGGMRWWVFV